MKMTAKFNEFVRTYWPIFVAVVGVIFFVGAWYTRTCALEASMQVVATKVDSLGERVEQVERNLTSLDYTATATATAVRDIQDILLTDRITRRAVSVRD